MVSLRRDSNGNFIARKRLPDDAREEYGRLYGARFEAKFFAPARLGKQHAEQRFHEWKAEVESRVVAIHKAQRGEGIDLDRKNAAALAGQWYEWFVARYEDEPGDPPGAAYPGDPYPGEATLAQPGVTRIVTSAALFENAADSKNTLRTGHEYDGR